MSSWPLRARVTASLASAALIAIVLVSTVSYLLAARGEAAVAAADAAAAADLAATMLPRAPGPARDAAVEQLAGAGVPLVVATVGGVEVARSAALRGVTVPPAPATGVETVELAGGPHLLTARRVGDLSLQLLAPLDDVEAVTGALVRSLALSALVAAVGSALAVGVLARRVLAPVEATARAARGLAEGALGTRVGDVGSGSLSDLGDAFDEMAAALETTVWQLERAEDVQRRFVADVSHELRTPLTVLSSAAELLRPGIDQLAGAPRRAAELLVDEVVQLAVLVDDLMGVSQLDAGHAQIDVQPVDVDRLIDELLVHRGWDQVRHRPSDDARPAPTDPRRLAVIVGNLLGNAHEHGAPPVEVQVRRTDALLEVDVLDAGRGVPADSREVVFERFHKEDVARTRREGGSGLGLALARENARLLGGDVTLLDGPGGGALFRLRLSLGTIDDADEDDLA